MREASVRLNDVLRNQSIGVTIGGGGGGGGGGAQMRNKHVVSHGCKQMGMQRKYASSRVGTSSLCLSCRLKKNLFWR